MDVRLFFLVSIAFVIGRGTVDADVCPRTPTGISRMGPRSPGDGRFKISIGLEPELYVGGNMYSVSISGDRPFRKFLLTAEKYIGGGSRKESAANSTPRISLDDDIVHPEDVGHFVLAPRSGGVYSEECINTVIEEAADSLKTSASAMWVAPANAISCISIRAMVFVDEEHWFADDGRLTRTLCPYRDRTTPSPTPTDCCACDEAKYQMVFEGLWSNVTHPKDFPSMLPLTHFSDVIGGTHHKQFAVWSEGLLATDGLKQLAEWGSPGSLHNELIANSRHLKTLVQAAGLWYPNVNGNTSTTFRVDRSKHLLSVVSMLGPSPDWIVGVSSLDLCNPDCTWTESRAVDLFPYDAGTDNGVSYMSPNVPTVPREPVRKITSFYPEDPRAPFYDPRGRQMPALARLHLRRVKVVRKSCDQKTDDQLLEEVATLTENNEDSNRRECEVTEYSDWSACSVSCGKGLRSRARNYLDENAARAADCDRQLVSKEMCVAENSRCPGDEDEDEDEQQLEDLGEVCKTRAWSHWSECSASCGLGIKMRTRSFENRHGRKRCQHVNTVEKEKCMQPPCSDTDTEPVDPLCPTDAWSEWSPCSVTCGSGLSMRTRNLVGIDDVLKEKCKARVLLDQRFTCHQEDCVFDLETAKQVCVLPEEHGPCRGLFERWRYEPAKGMCIPFVYGGCRGNRNNFATDTECLSLCSVIREMFGVGGSSAVTSSVADGNSSSSKTVEDCAVSGWSSWSECSVSCGRGIKSKSRTVLVQPRNGGVACPSLVAKRRCHRKCPASVSNIL